MKPFDETILANLRDWIGDALSDDTLTPEHISDTIKCEIRELIEYHKTQGARAQELLSLLETSPVLDEDHSFDWNFNLSSSVLEENNSYISNNPQWGSDVISFGLRGGDDDVIDFNNYNKKFNK